MNDALRQRWMPELALLAVVLIWSTTWIASKAVLGHIGPGAFLPARFIGMTLLAWTVLHFRYSRNRAAIRIARSDWPRLALGAFTGFTVNHICSTVALSRTSVFTVSLLIALIPLFTMVIMVVQGEALPPFAWPGVIVALIGVAIFLSDKERAGDSLLGIVLCLGAAGAFAVYGLVNRPLVRTYPPQILASWQLLIGTLPLLIFGLPRMFAADWIDLPLRIWLAFGFVIIFPVYIAYQLWNFGIAHRGAAVASSLGLLVPVLSAVMAALVLDEQLSVLKFAGALMVIIGLLIIRMPANWRQRGIGAASHPLAAPAKEVN